MFILDKPILPFPAPSGFGGVVVHTPWESHLSWVAEVVMQSDFMLQLRP